ncbi:MAG: hypothetical protein COU08_04410 [Candidatus Harrisonbacteria bacterium CG10_big_fil_rev_8_21_14_0_10_42_17]|uniref:M23ase beta-sheet core domain-containing protein n=1 Tax=Candidatus Harrisonbacteria bacterium CG10_big_fil_rev_8_21_14_0_10_42_17 TaxID=1974584 RepID=A0A2M6WH01_9BACT|nr:MAG: hypothetical protein COU08_04410 [Candidatus Harrisonbacteria bacterium CG10_big_fil_rev_8_21_14_0_10_42_17]
MKLVAHTLLIVTIISAALVGGAVLRGISYTKNIPVAQVHEITMEKESSVEKEIPKDELVVEESESQPKLEPKIAEEPVVKIESTLNLSSNKVLQGETLIIEAKGTIKNATLNGNPLTFSDIVGKQIAVIGFDTRATTGELIFRYTIENGEITMPITLAPKQYPVTKIVIPQELMDQGVTTGDLVTSIVQTDNVTLADILKKRTDFYYFTEPFVEPLDRWIDVGGFGNVREDQNGAIRHLGVDLDGAIGDPVYATNRGEILFAGDLQNYGNSIVIDHGLGIFSIYLHLSKISAEKGGVVERGEVIGDVGNTGAYTLEPHLHLGIKIGTNSVNPKNFIETFNKLLN